MTDPDLRLVGPALHGQGLSGRQPDGPQGLDIAQPGDVIVVDTSSSSLTAVLGDLVCTKARHRGVAGFIVDGLIRDLPAIRRARRLPRVRAGRDAEGPAAPRPGRDRLPDLLRRHRRQPRRRGRRRPERRRGRAAGHLRRAARRASTRRPRRSRTTSPPSHAATSTTTGSTRCSRRAAWRSGSPPSTSRSGGFTETTPRKEQGALWRRSHHGMSVGRGRAGTRCCRRPARRPSILGGGGTALPVARSLGEAGIPVYALGGSADPVRHSRRCTHVRQPRAASPACRSAGSSGCAALRRARSSCPARTRASS